MPIFGLFLLLRPIITKNSMSCRNKLIELSELYPLVPQLTLLDEYFNKDSSRQPFGSRDTDYGKKTGTYGRIALWTAVNRNFLQLIDDDNG
jgi:hypothetical protein